LRTTPRYGGKVNPKHGKGKTRSRTTAASDLEPDRKKSDHAATAAVVAKARLVILSGERFTGAMPWIITQQILSFRRSL
jgi:hypothetical protein